MTLALRPCMCCCKPTHTFYPQTHVCGHCSIHMCLQKQGNKKLEIGITAKNPMLLRDAIGLYGQGLAMRSSDAAVVAALHNNRAHVHSMLGESEPATHTAALKCSRDTQQLCDWL